jgi:hypothetical protein
MDATRSAGLRLPVQAVVDRTPSYGALADDTGVDASQNWGQIGSTLLNNLPGIISGIASLF